MTVTAQIPAVAHIANGVTTAFAYAFLVQVSGDMIVKVDGVTKTLGADYSISGLGVVAGGMVTFTVAPANGAKVLLYRSIPLSRSNDYQANGDLPEDLIDADFDRIWMVLQDIGTGNVIPQNVVRAPSDESLNELPVASARALKFLAFDASGQLIVVDGSTSTGSPFSALGESLVSRATPALMRTDLEAPSRNEIVSQAWTNATTTGTGTAYAVSPTTWGGAYAAGVSFFVNFHVISGNNPTLTIGGLATPPTLVKQTAGGSFTNILAGDIPANHRSRVTLISPSQALVETLPPPIVCEVVVRSNRNTTATQVVNSSPTSSVSTTSAANSYTETIDPSNVFNSGTGVLTIPRSGTYHFTGKVAHIWSASTGTTGPSFTSTCTFPLTIAGSVSGSYPISRLVAIGTNSPVGTGVDFTLNLIAGDTVTFGVPTPTYDNTMGVSTTLSPTGGAYPELTQLYTIKMTEVGR